MLNNNKKELGYRDVIYNIKFNQFFTLDLGDQYKPLPISLTGGGGGGSASSGGTAARPVSGEEGDLYFDTDLDLLLVWNGSEWQEAGHTTPSGSSANRPSAPYVGEIYFDTTLGKLIVWNGSDWKVSVQEGEASVHVGDTPPSNPISGQLWYYSNAGRIFVYYTDGTGNSQWVQS
jgi:hypothetical protein